jgi:hypothetical protein
LPDVRAPENPAGNPNLPNSKGFEGMALSTDGRFLLPLLEGTVAGDEPGTLRLNEFDLAALHHGTDRSVLSVDWLFTRFLDGTALPALTADVDDAGALRRRCGHRPSTPPHRRPLRLYR